MCVSSHMFDRLESSVHVKALAGPTFKFPTTADNRHIPLLPHMALQDFMSVRLRKKKAHVCSQRTLFYLLLQWA